MSERGGEWKWMNKQKKEKHEKRSIHYRFRRGLEDHTSLEIGPWDKYRISGLNSRPVWQIYSVCRTRQGVCWTRLLSCVGLKCGEEFQLEWMTIRIAHSASWSCPAKFSFPFCFSLPVCVCISLSHAETLLLPRRSHFLPGSPRRVYHDCTK